MLSYLEGYGVKYKTVLIKYYPPHCSWGQASENTQVSPPPLHPQGVLRSGSLPFDGDRLWGRVGCVSRWGGGSPNHRPAMVQGPCWGTGNSPHAGHPRTDMSQAGTREEERPQGVSVRYTGRQCTVFRESLYDNQGVSVR